MLITKFLCIIIFINSCGAEEYEERTETYEPEENYDSEENHESDENYGNKESHESDENYENEENQESDEISERHPHHQNNIVDVAIAAGDFKTLVQLLIDLDLVDTLRNKEAQTIFAPSDEAFSKLPEGTLESLSPEQAKATVLRHVLDGMTVPANAVVTGPVDTLGGEKITLIKTRGDVQISYMKNYMNVVNADVMADNGVIHVIDKVILPPNPGCKNKPEFGNCNGPKKFYFSQDKICQKDSPFGNKCPLGNENSFNTRRECLTTCGDCASKAVKGPCKANIQRYYFDKEKHVCKKFTYGGCKGNGNNYKTEQECFDTCGDCDSDPIGGPSWLGISCKAAFKRYYFDQDHKTCKRFTWGGCGGNNNNFHTKKACSKACKAKPITDDVKKLIECNRNYDCPKTLPKCHKMRRPTSSGKKGYCVFRTCQYCQNKRNCPTIGDKCTSGSLSGKCNANRNTCEYDRSLIIAKCPPFPGHCVEDSPCDVLGTENECPNGVCYGGKCKCTTHKCRNGFPCRNGNLSCGKGGVCHPTLGCQCKGKCKKSNSPCKHHDDCDNKSWCKKKTRLCVCKNPNKCIYGSVCKRNKDCGKTGWCNSKFGCMCIPRKGKK